MSRAMPPESPLSFARRVTSAACIATLVVACGQAAPPCESAECPDACPEDLEPPAGYSATPGQATLTSLEHQLLRQRIQDLERGPAPIPERGFGLCRGDTTCTTWLGKSFSEPLPPGNYVLHAELDVPQTGEWTATFDIRCTATERDRDGEHVLHERSRKVPLRRRPDGSPTVIDGIERFRSPSPRGEMSCGVKLYTHGDDRPQHVFGFVVPGA